MRVLLSLISIGAFVRVLQRERSREIVKFNLYIVCLEGIGRRFHRGR